MLYYYSNNPYTAILLCIQTKVQYFILLSLTLKLLTVKSIPYYIINGI